MNIELSIVIPCLNEAQTLAKAIRIARNAIDKSGMRGEVVIADNGSWDDSVSVAEKLSCRVVKEEKKGYGYALQKGIRSAAGRYIIIGDADTTYNFCEAVPFLEELKKGADLVLGSRLSGHIAPGAMPFLHRYLGTPVLTFLINLFFGTRISDVNCGLRAFTREAFEKLHIASGGMEFSSEMIVKAGIYRLKIVELPCSLHADPRNRKPHLRTWRDGWRHLRLILLFAPHIIFALPGWLMLFMGMLVTAIVLPKPFQAFGLRMDYHYLFYSIPLIILGCQALWFETFNKYFIYFSGYIPFGSQTEKPQNNFSLEIWLLLGSALSLTGIILLVILFIKWVSISFAYLFQIRLGIAGMLFLSCGVQTIMNAMMVSMMSIKVRR